MDKTFLNIGKAIKNDLIARSEYHPLVTYRNLKEPSNKKNKEGDGKKKDNIYTFELNVNLDNEDLSIDVAEDYPSRLYTIKFAMSSADTKAKYLIGNVVIKKEEVNYQLSFDMFDEKYLTKYSDILTPDSFICKFRKIIEKNLTLIKNKVIDVSDIDDIKEIAFIVNLTYKGKTDYCHNFSECLDEIDEMFLQSNEKNGKYTFFNSFYKMFNYSKYVVRNYKAMPDDSIPYYSKEDFLNLYYGKNIYDKLSFYIDTDNGYGISVFPNYDNLSIVDIENLMVITKKIFDFDVLCKELEKFVSSKTNVDIENKKIIPLHLKFDLYYRYDGGRNGWQNLLRLSGIRYAQIFKMRNKIREAYNISYEDDKFSEFNLYGNLFNFYKDINGNNDRYRTTIFKTLQNIYQNIYRVPQNAEYCLLETIQHEIRMDSNYSSAIWNRLFKFYKLIKIMENINYTQKLKENPSYKLGVELSKLEGKHWWKKDSNLYKTIQNFAGNIKRNVRSLSDVSKYRVDILERLVRNKENVPEHNKLITLIKTLPANQFDRHSFFYGYYDNKFFREEKEKTEQK